MRQSGLQCFKRLPTSFLWLLVNSSSFVNLNERMSGGREVGSRSEIDR